jgi:hypothetical protein
MTIKEFEDCSPRDTYNFILAGQEKHFENIEQGWDYARHIMWAAISAFGGNKKTAKQMWPLPKDKGVAELSPFDKQELSKWDEAMDEEMRAEGIEVTYFGKR